MKTGSASQTSQDLKKSVRQMKKLRFKIRDLSFLRAAANFMGLNKFVL